ncbi:MAG: ArsR/SmtB family transcription factor [Thermoproteus sp. AZ2]|jgi:DNA-binding transcriptional ArsR family regulator|uniref:ArsR/SmtB family transcription factor n=1 Tax=Thermoproteus sp. AZ2 TaxID=1609232 RepID=A0ACC6V202_9CREN
MHGGDAASLAEFFNQLRLLLPTIAALSNGFGGDEGAELDKVASSCPIYAKIRWLLVESRGALVRSKILLLLRERPTNINRIAKELGIDYKTAKHHLGLLEKNGLVKRLGVGYGDVYYIEDNAYKHWDELRKLIEESLRRYGDGATP